MSSKKQLHSLIHDKITNMKHELYTGMPARVVSYDAKSQSITAKPIFQTGEMPMPEVYNVPVIFPAGGGAVMTFPVKAGDLCWLSYSMYPIDEFISGSGDGIADNMMSRPHDMNECVAYVGMGTLSKNYNPDPDNVMIHYGETKLTLDKNGQAILYGNLRVKGKIVAEDTVEGTDFISSTLGKTFNGHVHHYFWTDPSGDADSQTPS